MGQAISALSCHRTGVLIERTPTSVLKHAPEHQVQRAQACRDRGDGICSVGSDPDVLVVKLPDSEGAVVGLREASAAVVIPDPKTRKSR